MAVTLPDNACHVTGQTVVVTLPDRQWLSRSRTIVVTLPDRQWLSRYRIMAVTLPHNACHVTGQTVGARYRTGNACHAPGQCLSRTRTMPVTVPDRQWLSRSQIDNGCHAPGQTVTLPGPRAVNSLRTTPRTARIHRIQIIIVETKHPPRHVTHCTNTRPH